jgi:hypothetical protein
MLNAINQFRKNIESINELGSIYELVRTNYPILKERAEEILRAEIVLCVSALDCYIHDLARISMIEIFTNTRIPNKAYDCFQISLKSFSRIDSAKTLTDKIGLFENEINEINSKDSFQSPSSIEYALRFLDIKNLWNSLSPIMRMSADDIKGTLSLIIHRRNKIAHEADYDFVRALKNPIDQLSVNNSIIFIINFCESVNALVTSH